MKIESNENAMRLVTIKLDGRLDALESPALRSMLTETIGDGPTTVVVDLSDVEFVDSAGLAALVKGMKDARLSGGDLRLVRPSSDAAMRVFELTRFDQVFAMAASADEAVRGW